MACVWVHLGIVQFTFLPTSSPKEMDCDCMVQVWPSLRLKTKSKVQGVLNKPHYKERKMNTEFLASNTTTCNDLISPSPILISTSLPRLTRGGECRQVSICRTHLIGLHTTWLHVTTQHLTGLLLYELHKHDWFFIYLWWRLLLSTGKPYLISQPYYYCYSSLPCSPVDLYFRDRCMVLRRGHSTSHVPHAWGSLGVHLP